MILTVRMVRDTALFFFLISLPFDFYQTTFGDITFLKIDHGTSHWSVYDRFGNAVAITSTINLNYGSLVIGEKTGILFNDQMDGNL